MRGPEAMIRQRPAIICVTPTRNEAWIIERFIRAARLWADHVVILDQGSTDGTPEIASQFDGVEVLRNTSSDYDEGARQRRLLAAARRIPGPRVIVALDADEFLSPNWKGSAEWREAMAAPAGTVIRFDWVNVLPDGRHAWVPAEKFAYGFVDDGSEHAGDLIHATRVPTPPNAPVRLLDEVKVIHMQYTDWPRMLSKQRWYQCWERINNPGKRPIQIFRQYHRMDAFPKQEVRPVDHEWLRAYAEAGVDLTPAPSNGPFWWDEDVLHWLVDHGATSFAKIDLWDVDWSALAASLDVSAPPERTSDPRRPLDKAIHKWLKRTQPSASTRRTRWCQRALIPLGW